jgi:hypothetical protein
MLIKALRITCLITAHITMVKLVQVFGLCLQIARSTSRAQLRYHNQTCLFFTTLGMQQQSKQYLRSEHGGVAQ